MLNTPQASTPRIVSLPFDRILFKVPVKHGRRQALAYCS